MTIEEAFKLIRDAIDLRSLGADLHTCVEGHEDCTPNEGGYCRNQAIALLIVCSTLKKGD